MELDFKPSVINWLIVGIMAVTFIVLAKFVVNKWTVPGLTDVINAV